MGYPEGPRTGRPASIGKRGMISTSHQLASAAGHAAMRGGGSAVDAAIAANAVLCVVYPHMAGLGGDAFWLIHDPADAGVYALNASGPSAAGASIAYYRNHGCEKAIPGRGALAALTVPGAVDGWREMHRHYGRLPWEELFTDAIAYARDGFAVARSLAYWTARDAALLGQYPPTATIYLPGNAAPRPGAALRNPALADTFERIARNGARQGFYEGETAQAICNALGPKGSPLTAEDFANYRAEWVSPISTDYRGYTVYECPPNTQGFAALQILNLIEGYDVAAWGDWSVDYYHHMAEAVKLAFADRNAWLTDPNFLDIPLDRLLDKNYARERRRLIDAEHAMDMERVKPGVPAGSFASGPVVRGDTCYFCAVDTSGLAVSVIQSIYEDFGSVDTAGDTGVILHNRGSFFSLDHDHPNRLEPGKRTFHTLIPAMLFRGDQPYLVFGSMGGEGQPQTHAALITRIVDFGYDVQQAIEAPRWLMGRAWGTKTQELSLEGRIGDPVVDALLRRGHPTRQVADWSESMGHAQAIRIHPDTGFLEGGADPRGDGAAIGY